MLHGDRRARLCVQRVAAASERRNSLDHEQRETQLPRQRNDSLAAQILAELARTHDQLTREVVHSQLTICNDSTKEILGACDHARAKRRLHADRDAVCDRGRSAHLFAASSSSLCPMPHRRRSTHEKKSRKHLTPYGTPEYVTNGAFAPAPPDDFSARQAVLKCPQNRSSRRPTP
jgi:hypothetical protein